MSVSPTIAFIGAGSTIFMKNIIGDVLHRPALSGAVIRLMDIDQTRLDQSRLVAEKLVATLGASATVEATTDRRRALDGADFVVVAFQIGGFEPATVVDFEVPEQLGLKQTIAYFSDLLSAGDVDPKAL